MIIIRNLFPGGKPRALTLSYDDGVGQDLPLIERLNRHGVKCTFNLNSGSMNGQSRTHPSGAVIRHLTKEEIVANYKGHELATHGYTHPFLNAITPDCLACDILRDRMAIEEMAGAPVRGHAYPFGAFDDAVVERLRALGIVYARTTISSEQFGQPSDFLRWQPTCHHNSPRLDELCDKFLSASNRAKGLLFYLWGHSYEFDTNGNWDVIDRFLDKMSGRDDIWYATNIEVYDYITAQNSVYSTLDGKVACNPSGMDVWVSSEKGPVMIPAGGSVSI